ncbi:unnamed protein product [Vitrella brassicaformis CCMP3155]|uniref:Uncharacterized protein n=1 Tax=Vitrella brassicaformis (strain CCMP3155) TaxID=1169540 RepID=A0A0G4ENU5_VITBC|nr:unnamed protein product [Vitrella brassicaformis CCMP3155]|eukprot:CEL99288.1 unnamed protein product [Vitrella brassicaformis CCMP3155]
MLGIFMEFFRQQSLRDTGIPEKKALEGDSVPHRIFVSVAWAYMTLFLLTVPLIGLLYLPSATRPYERALCIVGLIYITVGSVVFLGIVGPVLRASRLDKRYMDKFRPNADLCSQPDICLPSDGVPFDPILMCLYACSEIWARIILPVAALCCDVPGLLYTFLRLRREKDEEKHKGLEKMKGFFFCASLISVIAALILLLWLAMLLWRDVIVESSIAVEQIVGD